MGSCFSFLYLYFVSPCRLYCSSNVWWLIVYIFSVCLAICVQYYDMQRLIATSAADKTVLWCSWRSPTGPKRPALSCYWFYYKCYTIQYVIRSRSIHWTSLSHVLCFACSLFSGFVSAVAATPADVVKSRMMNQAYKNRRYCTLV